MKKLLKMILCVLMISSVFTGCGAEETAQSPQTPTSSPAMAEATAEETSERVDLTLCIAGNQERVKVFQDLFDGFAAESNIFVEVKTMAYDNPVTKFMTDVAAGVADDIVWNFESGIGALMSTGHLEDISAIRDDSDYNYADIYPSLTALCEMDGKVYGIPMTGGARVMYYNKDIFAAAGLDDPLVLLEKGEWTWDNVFKMAVRMTDKSKGIYGLSLFNYGDVKDWTVLCDYVWSNGADFFDDDISEARMNTPEMIDSLQRFYDLIYVDGAHVKPGDQITFESGLVAMTRNQFSFHKNLQEVPFDWDMAPLPSGPVSDAPMGTGLAAYTVLKGCENVDAAIEALKFISGTEGQIGISNIFAPVRKSLLEDEVFLNATETKPTPAGRKAAGVDTFKELRVFPAGENMPEISVKMKEIFDYIYSGSLTIEEAVAKMETETAQYLK